MKVRAYIYTEEQNEIKREQEVQRQKFAIADFCYKNGYTLVDCVIENCKSNIFEYPVLFNLLSNNKDYDKIIFCSYNIFDSNPEFQNWIFSELKARNIRFDFASKQENVHNAYDIETKKEKIIEKANNVPSLPGIVTKTLQLIQNDKSSAMQLAKIIKYDTGLTGKILKLVNSSFYGFSKQISSIQHGITILGFNTIKGLVISSNIYKSFKSSSLDDGFDYNGFWLHTTLCATISNDFAARLNFNSDEKEEIFSSAILHDIGKLILNKYDNQNYKNVLINQSSPLNTKHNISLEEQYCAITHTIAGKIVTEKWNLPEIISQTAAFHHSPLESEKSFQKAISIISIANTLTNFILHSEDLSKEAFPAELIELTEIKYDTILDKFNNFKQNPEKISELKNFFNEE